MEYLDIRWRPDGRGDDVDVEEEAGAGGPDARGATADLARIRALMEGTATYPVLSAASAALAGAAALAACAATWALLSAEALAGARPWAMAPAPAAEVAPLAAIWGGALALAAAGELLFTKRTPEGRRLRSFWLPRGSPLLSRVRLAYAAPLLAGAALTGALLRAGAPGAIPAAWLLSYGAALICAGLFSSPGVRLLGGALLALGAVAAAFPAANLALVGAGLGVCHIVYAAMEMRSARASAARMKEDRP